MHVDVNSKFAAVFMSRCAVGQQLPDEIDLGAGVRAGGKVAVDMGHWSEWLGSLAMDELREDGLLIYVTAPAEHPAILDGENVALGRRLDDVLNGLLMQGVPSFMRGFILNGANVGGEIQVRQHSGMRHVEATWESERFVVGMSQLTNAVGLARQLREIQDASDAKWARLVRGVRTLLKANREDNAHGGRLHQFVRALEGLIKPRIAKSGGDFAHRAQTFAVASGETREILVQMFSIRSHVEHLHAALDAVLPGATEAERIALVNRRTRQADALARFSLCKVLEFAQLYDTFSSDERIDGFWALQDGERRAIWGDRLDVRGVA